MKNIVNGYKEAIKQNGREIEAKITYTLNGVSKELGNEILNSLTPHYEGGLLKSVMKQLDIDSNEDIPLETQINAQFGLKVNDEYKYINLGDYIVYSSEKQEDTRSYKIIAYDKLLYSMKPYERLTTKNLFDNTNVVENEYYNETGSIITNSDYIRTDNYTWCYGLSSITISGTPTYTSAKLIFYDENKNYVDYWTSNNRTINIPNGAYYFRVSCPKNVKDTMMIEKGSSATTYTNHYVQYPITIRDYLKAICYQLGITFANANDTFVNYDKEIESELYLDSEGYSLDFTYRDVLDQLAQVTASTICINDDNELEIRYINDTLGNLLDENTLTITPSSNANWEKASVNNVTSNTFTDDGWVVTTPNSGNLNNGVGIALKNANDVIPVGSKVTFSIDITGSAQYGKIKLFYMGNGPYWYSNVIELLDTTTTSNDTIRYSVTFNMPDVGQNDKRLRIAFPQGNRELTTRTYKNAMLEFGNGTYYSYSGDNIDEEYLKDINVNFGEKYGPINTITFKRSAGSDMISRSIPEDLSDDLKNEISIEDNEILNGNDRDEFIDGILNKLYGLEYYLNDYSSTGITYYDLCDRYNVKVDDNFYSCIMFNDEIEITQGLVENIHTDKPEESETDYSKTSKTDRTIKQAYIMVDKANQTIDSFTGQVTDLQSLVNSQGEQITELGVRVTQNENSWQTSVSSIQNQLANGVSLVKTTSVIINNEGLNVSDDTSKIQTTMTTNAFKITPKGDSNTLLAFIGYDEEQGSSVAKMDNLTITNYFTSGYHRTEGVEDMENARGDTEDRTCVFYIGG